MATDVSTEVSTEAFTEASTEVSAESQFQFLNLPAELRIRIYEYALAPTGTLCLTSSSSKRYCTDPTIAATLLVTCRQIHTEAVDILYDNNSICTYVDTHDTSKPTISDKRLPPITLKKLRRLCVILDCSSYFQRPFSDVDWTPFSALTSLRYLRITMVKQDAQIALAAIPEAFQVLLTRILERIPAAAAVVYGTEPESSEREYVAKVARRRQEQYFRKDPVEEVNKEGLATVAAAIVDLQRGCKSGGVE